MKNTFITIVIFGLILSACAPEHNPDSNPSIEEDVLSKIEIPQIEIQDSLLVYKPKYSRWYYEGKLFSGYGLSFFPDGKLEGKFGVYEGRKQNESIQWYPDGHVKHSSNYHEGKLHGEKKKWSSDASHILLSHLNYKLGRAHGEQKVWYPTGELFKKLQFNMGVEEGIQQAYRKNGDLYANYEAKNGRIFGLKKTALCYGLEEENVIYEN